MFTPLHLRLTHRRILVVGAGAVGRRRVAGFTDAGARIRWVSPDLNEASTPDLEVIATPFEPHHCDEMELVVACGPPEVNAWVGQVALARRLWLCRADAPDEGDVRVPALVRRGPLVVGLSTGAPAATAALRRLIDARIPNGFGYFADLVAEARRRLAGQPHRSQRLAQLISGPFAAVLESQAPPAPAVVERWLAAEWAEGAED